MAGGHATPSDPTRNNPEGIDIRPMPGARPTAKGSQSPSSPLTGDRFENLFRPFSGSYPDGKTLDTDVTGRPSSGDDIPQGSSDEKRLHHSHFIQDFQTEPSYLRFLPQFRYLCVDLVLTAMPVVFIVYAILAACLHGRPTGSFYFGDGSYNWSGELYGPAMLIVQSYVVTFFPMAFNIVVARLVSAFALWRAEHGTHLGFLEQLNGSTSLGGTFGSLWGMRIINWVGVVLFAIWALSPVGSQAGLRIISANGTYVDTTRLYQMDTRAIPPGLETESDDLQYYTFAVNALYSTSLLTPSSVAGPQDPWTNVKIPSLEWLEQNGGCDGSGWCSRALATKNMGMGASLSQVTAGTWTSLTGIPVVGGQFGVGFQNFTLSASYFVFDCTSLDVVDPSADLSSPIPGRGDYNTNNNSSIWDSGNSGHPNTFFVDTTTPLAGLGSPEGDARVPGAQMPPRNLLFGSRAPDGTTLANCTVSMANVLAEVNCNFTAPLWNVDKTQSGHTSAGACYVDRVRRDPGYPTKDTYTALDASYRIAQRFFEQWPLATGNVPGGTSSPTERFINDVNSDSASSSTNSILVATDWLGFNTSDHDGDGGISYVDISEHGLPTFTERFALVFNTFWHAFCNLQAMTQSEIGLGFGTAFPPGVMFTAVNATLSVPGQHYVVNFAWLGVLMLCAVVAMLAGIFALVFKYSTLMPDVLGKVSMLVKENPYTPLPRGGAAVDGQHFARKVMHMPVRFADVRANEPVGHIALTSMDIEDDEGRRAPLMKGRLYH